jgi:hypothetical protein
MTPTTRRAVIGAAVSLPALAAPALAQADPIPARWTAFIRSAGWWHPRGADAALLAYKCGMDLNKLSTLMWDGPRLIGGYPALYFGDLDRGDYFIVQPESVGRYQRVKRGDGPKVQL